MRGKVILNPKKIENNIRIMAPKMDEERGTQGKKRRKKKDHQDGAGTGPVTQTPY
jgi:hypothetical protein